MTSYGLTDLCNEIGLTGAAQSLKYIYDNAASLLKKWSKIRPGITDATQNRYKGITPYPVNNITTDYNKNWPVDFTPDSDAYGPIKALSQFVDLANNLVYKHNNWEPATSFEVVVVSNGGAELSTNEVYNGSIDVHGDTYDHTIRCRIYNLNHPDAEHIGLEDVLGATGRMAVWAVPSGSGPWKRKPNPAVLTAVGGGVFDLDIASEAWEADTYTIYPLFVNGASQENNFSFPSAGIGVGSIVVKNVPDYPFIALDSVIICDDNQVAADVSQQTLHIPFSIGSFQLHGFNKDVNGNIGTPTDVTHGWSSRNTGVVTVDPNTGLCTFVSAGQATIDLTGYQHYFATLLSKSNWVVIDCTVVITISINPTTVEMGTGNHTSAQVTGSVAPINAINRRINYTSSNTNVVQVQNGTTVESDIPVTINAIAVGSANVIAKAYGDQSKTATAVVNVRQGCTGLAITEATLALYLNGDPVTLHTNVQPNNAYNQAVTFESSNPGVATVDANGKVTPVGVGTCIITGKTQDTYYSAQQYSDTVSVTVSNPTPVIDGIVISGYGGAVNIGSSFTLHVYYHYSDGTTGTTDIANANNWSGYGNNFSISGTGTFTATAEGSCIITYTVGGYTASVYATASRYVSSIAITTYQTPVTLGSSAVAWGITATWRIATNSYTTTTPASSSVSWSSDNANIASVNSSGQVSPVAVGSTTIRASYGGMSASQAIVVQQAVEVVGIYYNGDDVTGQILDLALNDSIQLTAYYSGTATSYQWSTTSAVIAQVLTPTAANITVRNRGTAGTATVTLKINGDSNLTASVTIRASNN